MVDAGGGVGVVSDGGSGKLVLVVVLLLNDGGIGIVADVVDRW